MKNANSLVRQWFDGLNSGKLAASAVTENFVYRGSETELSFDEIINRVKEYRKQYPELLFSIDFVVQHANKVGIAWTAVTRGKSSRGIGTGTLSRGKFVDFTGVMPNL